ncbi:hypothetical protein [Bythopirellula polymerisocia]|uniref:Uncharacterized protein n=1 Tax=Bythopirellula polymerisocia TaxID=2528003 RepID=A0A5C6CXI8_9BACT|nr:hypothetical protein [Bythopirellula polymerisocia]TWU27349.1 hypothetical protein Pla144_21210 [Bythopirellula polymerisocia]
MTSLSSGWSTSGAPSSLLSCALFLLVVMAIFVGCSLPIAFWIGNTAWLSLLTAASICFAAGLAALVISYQFSLAGQNLAGMLLAMGCRLVPPLMVCLWLALNKNQANHNSFVGFLIASYLVSLAAETFLSVQMIDSLPSKPASH